MKSIKVAIVDDHSVLAEALAMVINREPNMEFGGVAGTLAACRLLLKQTCPDVLLLDVSLPDGDGLSLVPEIKQNCSTTNIVVLTSFSDEQTLLRAIDSGVNGFVAKNQPLSEVMAAIRRAADGEITMPSSLLLGLIARVTHPPAAAPKSREAALTSREREVLSCLARGKATNEIANDLNIRPLTVRTHIRNLMGKLGAHSRLEAVMIALRAGLVESPL